MVQLDYSRIPTLRLTYSLKVKPSDRFQIHNSQDACNIFRQFWPMDQIEYIEQVKLLLMNRANRVLGIAEISTGGVSGSVIDPKVIFQYALKANASCFILAHNHPSGNLKPSGQDVEISKKLKEGAKILSMSFLDHLIITADGYLSLSDECYL